MLLGYYKENPSFKSLITSQNHVVFVRIVRAHFQRSRAIPTVNEVAPRPPSGESKVSPVQGNPVLNSLDMSINGRPLRICLAFNINIPQNLEISAADNDTISCAEYRVSWLLFIAFGCFVFPLRGYSQKTGGLMCRINKCNVCILFRRHVIFVHVT